MYQLLCTCGATAFGPCPAHANLGAPTITVNQGASTYSLPQAPQGWQCPVCKQVFSPFTPKCDRCGAT